MAMKKTAFSLPLSFLFVLLLSFNPGGTVKLVNGDGQCDFSCYRKLGCVAKPSSGETILQENINYACGLVNCDILNNACFNPENLINHASVAMNLYYQSVGRNPWNCVFKGSGLIVLTDPSYDSCVYEFKE